MFLVGAFLLSQIPTTAALTSQLAILGSLGLIGGASFWAYSFRDLFGRITIDDQGISARPNLMGFSIPWDELVRWEMKDDGLRHADAPSIQFWIQGEPCPMFIPNGWLNDAGREHLRQALWCRATSKCKISQNVVGQ